MKIERMTAAHLDGVCAIENACFAHPWSRQSIEAELDNETSLFYAAVEDGQVIGYIGMSFVLDEGLVTHCRKNNFAFLTLEVRESNAPARSLYEKFGFIKVGERKNYYSDPTENAVLMTLYF